MTVSFKSKTSISFDDIVAKPISQEAYFKEFKKEVKDPWWITRTYTTQSEAPPIKWVPYDHSTYSSIENLEDGFQEWISYVSKADASGWKIITLALDMDSGQTAFEPSYCKEHFKPKEKIYINGPKKKNPFLAKKGGQYV